MKFSVLLRSSQPLKSLMKKIKSLQKNWNTLWIWCMTLNPSFWRRVYFAVSMMNSRSMSYAICSWSSFSNCVRSLTNKYLLKKRNKNISIESLDAYIGKELAIAIVQLNNIPDFWSTKMFLWKADLKRVISRSTFSDILSGLKFYPEYHHEVSVLDPLWHPRTFFEEHFFAFCPKILWCPQWEHSLV